MDPVPRILSHGGLLSVLLLSLGSALAARLPASSAVPGEVELRAARQALLARNDAEGVLWCRKAAALGSVAAQFYLGLLYQEGRGVPQDYATAADWYRRAAEAGSIEAQYNLGNLYEKGLGVPRDPGQALRWFRRAAEQALAAPPADRSAKLAEPAEPSSPAGIAPRLATERIRGGGLSAEDYAKKLQESAEAGDPEAQYKLGELYEKGEGVPLDPVLGAQWKSIAARKGYQP